MRRSISLALRAVLSACVASACSSSGSPVGGSGAGGARQGGAGASSSLAGADPLQAGAAGLGGATGGTAPSGQSGQGGEGANGAGASSGSSDAAGGGGSGAAGLGAAGSAASFAGTDGNPLSELSGMPIPPTNGVAKPSGTPSNLTVLAWAGFKAAVSFTFDDALSSQVANYPALQATGEHFTFYLVSNNNATSSTWTQAAKDGHELGNHTAHHCHDDGTGCTHGSYAGSLPAELDPCTAHITQQFGVSDVWTAASPFGDTGYEAPDSTRFLLNRGVKSGQVGVNDDTSPYALPCHTAATAEAASTFNGLTDSARESGKWQIFLVHSFGGDGGYNPLSITDVVSAINHAKSAADVWVDSLLHVGVYWRAQKLFSTVTPSSAGSNKTWTWALPAHFPPGSYLRVKVDGGTLSQGNKTLSWSSHGYYEVALDAGSVTLSP